MENTKYTALTEHLKNILKTAKKLGLNVQPGGGYSMGYSINNLPPYPVGLFGALSIVDGQGGRCKLGLTFDETESLEAGFNGNFPDARNKTKKKRKSFKPDAELIKIGGELALNYANRPSRRYGYNNDWNNGPFGGGMAAAGGMVGGGQVVVAAGNYGGGAPKKKLQKKMQALAGVAKEAQVAPGYWNDGTVPNLADLEAKTKLINEFVENLADPNQNNKHLLDELMKKTGDIAFKLDNLAMDLQPEDNNWQQVDQWKDVDPIPVGHDNLGEG